jgi:hypothetical protein
MMADFVNVGSLPQAQLLQLRGLIATELHSRESGQYFRVKSANNLTIRCVPVVREDDHWLDLSEPNKEFHWILSNTFSTVNGTKIARYQDRPFTVDRVYLIHEIIAGEQFNAWSWE